MPGQVPAAEALPLYEEMLSLRQELGDTWGVAGAHNAIAALQLKRGARGAAVAHVAAALPLFESVADMLGVAECLESVGLVRYERRESRARRRSRRESVQRESLARIAPKNGEASCVSLPVVT